MRDAIRARQPGILTYGITPPKQSYSEEKRRTVAERQAARIRELPIDGLVVYDLQDESERTDEARPFPFLETIDPVAYAFDYLADVAVPKCVYRCVAPLDEAALSSSLERIDSAGGLSVFVGPPSRSMPVTLRLADAYQLHAERFGSVPLGGVLIAERHEKRGAEHEKVLRKMDSGCSFFVTQAVYSSVATRNVLSDVLYRCRELNQPVPPILITLTPCGSTKTLEFLRWLGVQVPRWLENELVHADDTLETSVNLCADILADLTRFAVAKGIPLGCNVESVSLRKAEIDASVELVHRARAILDAGGQLEQSLLSGSHPFQDEN